MSAMVISPSNITRPVSLHQDFPSIHFINSWSYNNFLEMDVLTLISGGLSLLGTCLSIYWLFKMDPSYYRYRHKLYMYLMITDWVRAMVHVIYPALSLHALVSENYESKYFTLDHFDACDFFGFLTNTAFMSSDVVITMIALHTIMTIKEASQNQKHHIYKKSKHKFSFKQLIQPSIEQDLDDEKISLITENHGYLETKDFIYKQESGLYSYDFFLLTCLIIGVPIFLCAISYIGGYKMQNYFAFCYPDAHPTWRRVVSAWLLRFIAFAIIIFSYFGIYIYISFKFRQLTKEHKRLAQNSNLSKTSTNVSDQSSNQVTNWLCVLKSGLYNAFFNVDMKDEDSFLDSETGSASLSLPSISPTITTNSINVVLPQVATAIKHHHKQNSSGQLEDNTLAESPVNETFYPGNAISTERQMERVRYQITTDLFKNSLEDFKIRKKQSLRSLQLIFVYPASYVFIWAIPFISQCYRFANEPPPFGLSASVSCFQAIDGFVQTLIFAYREKPWRYFTGLNITKTTNTDPDTTGVDINATMIPPGENYGDCLYDQHLEHGHNNYSSRNITTCSNGLNGNGASISGEQLSTSNHARGGQGIRAEAGSPDSYCFDSHVNGHNLRQSEEIDLFDALNAPRY